MENTFYDLKQALMMYPVLRFPYFTRPKAGWFMLDTDFCKDQVARVLSQEQNGQEFVIAFWSKKTNKVQRNWPLTKGELSAGMYWMVKYHYYLQYDQKFCWHTDNNALCYIKNMHCPSGIINRWLNTLANFNFDIQHRPGIKHMNVDGLTRSRAATISIAKEDIQEDEPNGGRITDMSHTGRNQEAPRRGWRSVRSEEVAARKYWALSI